MNDSPDTAKTPAPDAASRLSSAEPRVRIEALLSLLAEPDPEQILPHIYHLKGDPDPDVRYVAQKLERLARNIPLSNPEVESSSGTKAREKFSELLSNQRSRARLGALTKALKYKTRDLLPLVEERLAVEESPPVIAAMVSLLGQLGHYRYIKPLLPLLGQPDARVVAHTVTALSNLAGDAVLPLFKPLLSHKDSRVVGSALSAILNHDPDCVFQTLEHLVASDLESDLECALHCLCQLEDPRGIPIGAKILAKVKSEELAEATRDYLARAEAAPESFLDALRQGLGNPDAAVRLHAIAEATEHLDHPEIRGLVEMLAQMDPEPAVAQAARNAAAADLAELGESRSSQSASALLSEPIQAPEEPEARQEKLISKFRGLLTRRQERLRMKAVLKVKKYQEKDLLPLILERMEWETSPIVLAAMLATLADIGTEAEVPLISPYLSHRNYRVVNAAILALHRLGGDAVLPLFLLLLNRNDPRIQSQALVALLRLDSRELVLTVQSMALSPSEEVRTTALTYLERLKAPEVEDILVIMIDRERSGHLLSKEVALLRSVATTRSAAPLLMIKQQHPEREVIVHQVLQDISERSGQSVPDLELVADEFLKSRPELPIFKELRAGEAAKPPEPAPLPHLTYERPRSDTWRLGVFGVVVLVCVAYGLVQSVGDNSGTTGLDDLHRRVQRHIEDTAISKPKVYVELGSRSTPISVEKLREVAESWFPKVPTLSPEQRFRWHRDYLKSAGYDNDEYIDMKARGECRDAFLKALDDARKRVDEKDFDGAITILKDAISSTAKENLLVFRDLYTELSAYLLRAGRAQESRSAALTANDMTLKILQVCHATKRPGSNQPIASDEDIAKLKGYRQQIEASYDQAGRLGLGPNKDLAAIERDLVKKKLSEFRGKGILTESEYRSQLSDVEAGRQPAIPDRLTEKGGE